MSAKNIITYLTLILLIIGTGASVYQCNMMKEERDEALRKAESELRKAESEQYRRIQAEKKLEEKISVVQHYSAFYRTKISNAVYAMNELRELERPEMVNELGYEEWNRRIQEKRNHLRVSALALCDFVREWKALLEDIKERLNGRIRTLEYAAANNMYEQVKELIELLQQNLDSDLKALIEFLKNSLKELKSE
jgi:hypothetical protein